MSELLCFFFKANSQTVCTVHERTDTSEAIIMIVDIYCEIAEWPGNEANHWPRAQALFTRLV